MDKLKKILNGLDSVDAVVSALEKNDYSFTVMVGDSVFCVEIFSMAVVVISSSGSRILSIVEL